jgi:hypothetical protein
VIETISPCRLVFDQQLEELVDLPAHLRCNRRDRDGERNIFALWPATVSRSGQRPHEIKYRGLDDVCIVVCDGLKGLS